jgi:hypothetical protein
VWEEAKILPLAKVKGRAALILLLLCVMREHKHVFHVDAVNRSRYKALPDHERSAKKSEASDNHLITLHDMTSLPLLPLSLSDSWSILQNHTMPVLQPDRPTETSPPLLVFRTSHSDTHVSSTILKP